MSVLLEASPPTSSSADSSADLSTQSAALLDEAARVIENYGWNQYDFWRNAEVGKPWLGTGVCAIGGLLIACGQTQAINYTPIPVIRAVSAAEMYLKQHDPQHPNLASCNDVVASRPEQIITLLRATAQALRDGQLTVLDLWEAS